MECGPTKKQYEEAKKIVGTHKRKLGDILLGRSPYDFEDIRTALMVVSVYEGYHKGARAERKAECAAEFGGRFQLYLYQFFETIVGIVRVIIVGVVTLIGLILLPLIKLIKSITRR